MMVYGHDFEWGTKPRRRPVMLGRKLLQMRNALGMLAYASAARLHLEYIIDDDALLPDKLPGTFNYQRFKRKATQLRGRL